MFAKDGIFSRTAINVTKNALDTYSLRSKAMANNFANITTPGYRRIDVAFEENLKEALNSQKMTAERTDDNHFHTQKFPKEMVKGQAYRSLDATQPGELNNVDVDIEMSKLAENTINFNFGVKFIQERMMAIESAIKTQG